MVYPEMVVRLLYRHKTSFVCKQSAIIMAYKGSRFRASVILMNSVSFNKYIVYVMVLYDN